MPSGFDRNVATEMPRTGKGAEPRAPWDVQTFPPKTGGGPPAVALRRYATLERGKADVLEKIRDLKAELEASFATREDLQGRTEEQEGQIRALKETVETLKQDIGEAKRDIAFQKEAKESLQKKLDDAEQHLHRERAEKEELERELSETRIALDEIHTALR